MNPKPDSRGAPPPPAPAPQLPAPAVRTLLGRGWRSRYQAALVVWLPLIKWSLPGGVSRTALFYGGGLLLSLVAVRHGGLRHRGGWPRARVLFRAPVAGLAVAAACFAALMVLSALLLSFSWPRAHLPSPLPELMALFDPRPVFAFFSGGGPEFPAGKAFGWGAVGWAGGAMGWAAGAMGWAAGAMGWAAGAIAEEWIFRVALLWMWVATKGDPGTTADAPAQIPAQGTAKNPAPNPGSHQVDPLPPMGVKLVLVSAYFAALHWPQSFTQLTVAFLGAMALGGVLLRWRNFYLISGLHVLFNLKAFSGAWGM